MREENCQICGSYSCDGNPCEEDELRKNAQKDSPTPEQTLERLKEDEAKEFYLKFGKRFIEIAQMADMGDDVGYGKGLAKLEIDIRNYHLEKLEKTWQTAYEAKRDELLGLLRECEPFLSDYAPYSTTTLEYVTPAESMRRAADRIEYEQDLKRRVKEALTNPNNSK